ncbi:MAG: hypothetical protein ACTSPV_13810 [Candidatus Hodarchaeales archaeon]
MIKDVIERVMKSLPEVENIIVFNSFGTVLQTTFDKSLNIPKIGKNISKILDNILALYKSCKYDYSQFNRILFDTEGISILILKLGEDTYLAFFFKKILEEDEPQIDSVKRYLKQIEELLDVSNLELLEQEKEEKREELVSLDEELEILFDRLNLLQKDIESIEHEDDEKKKRNKEIEQIQKRINRIKDDRQQKINEVNELEEKLEERKHDF